MKQPWIYMCSPSRSPLPPPSPPAPSRSVFYPFLHIPPHQNLVPENNSNLLFFILLGLARQLFSCNKLVDLLGLGSARILALSHHIIFHPGQEVLRTCSVRGRWPLQSFWGLSFWTCTASFLLYSVGQALRLVQMHGGWREFPLERKGSIFLLHNGIYAGLGRIWVC